MNPLPRVILASASPRRQELLKILIGDNFEVIPSDYPEDNRLKIPPRDLVLLHSREKGRDVAAKVKNGIVISADTVIVFKDETLGKPETSEKAIKMLQKINGQIVESITGITVIDVEKGKELQDLEITKIKMKKMSVEEIQAYVATNEPLDKAGAFGIQGKAAVLIEKIEGDYFNIVGLPLFKLNNLLNQLGISIFS